MQNEKRLVHFAASVCDLFSSNLKLETFTREYVARVKRVMLPYRFVLLMSARGESKKKRHRTEAMSLLVMYQPINN